jgi:signal transduction histidine kinase
MERFGTASSRNQPFCPIDRSGGGLGMSDEWHDGERRRRRRKRRERRRDEARGGDLVIDEVLLTPEERAYRDARDAAEQKVKITGDVIKFGAIVSLLLIIFWPIGLVVLICGGGRRLKDLYELVLEPKLRQKFVEKEVEKQVHATLSKERRLLEGEHARSLEQLSASIAHEIRNPITAAKSLVQQMEEDPRAAENLEYARVALEELNRVERSVSHLLRFARDEGMGIGDMRMADVIDSALETFRDRLARTGIALEQRIDCEGAMRGDAEKLRRVVINLVGNALDALEEGRTENPRLFVEMGENLAGSEVWLRIRDNGPGIEPQAVERMFSPFYTSKANGTGLGLAICKKLVDAHSGRIEVSSKPEQGAEFLLTFPKLPTGEEVRS